MPDLPKPGAVLFGKDLDLLAGFYEGTAALSVTLAEPGVVVLEGPGQQLVLHGLPADVARGIDITSPPALRSKTAVKLVFAVASLDQARLRAAALGGGLKPKRNEFDARGFRACDGHDPEGNVIQFRELAR